MHLFTAPAVHSFFLLPWVHSFSSFFFFATLFPLEWEMATHSSILAWRSPWIENPGGLLSMGLQRVGHDWSNLACMHALEKGMATHPRILAWRTAEMGEPGGLPSMGSHRVGHDCSDLAAEAPFPSSIYCVPGVNLLLASDNQTSFLAYYALS